MNRNSLMGIGRFSENGDKTVVAVLSIADAERSENWSEEDTEHLLLLEGAAIGGHGNPLYPDYKNGLFFVPPGFFAYRPARREGVPRVTKLDQFYGEYGEIDDVYI